MKRWLAALLLTVGGLGAEAVQGGSCTLIANTARGTGRYPDGGDGPDDGDDGDDGDGRDGPDRWNARDPRDPAGAWPCRHARYGCRDALDRRSRHDF
ncbi:hypothetical protein ACL598_21935 [Bordetella bronchialis]|uniref:Uncharacterized protein n=1 Tax=Bordetella bronchialis TaxID=463025 RepID=A0A193G1Z8_9BORD|nr:hypothetical protein [Bordetella bronchialis]ANN73698.1 hypothetical protein BAU08_22140 [Bordetella bronchialis]